MVKYSDSFLVEVYYKSARGDTLQSILSDLGISLHTYFSWCKQHPELREARESGINEFMEPFNEED
jgi:hypothetical protein